MHTFILRRFILIGLLAFTCFQSGDGVASAPLIGRSLEDCNTALKSIDLFASAVEQSLALAKCSESIKITTELAQNPTLSLLANEKLFFLATCEQNMFLLEAFIKKRVSEASSTHQIPILSQATSLENQYRQVLSALHNIPTWNIKVSGGAGGYRYLDGNLVSSAGAQLFLLLDHGNEFKVGIKFRLMTSLKEEPALIEFPPREVDNFGVSQLWLSFTRYQNIFFKVGLFPDEDGYLNPKEWPFVSFQASFKLITLPRLRWDWRLRHDLLGTYSPTQQVAQATLVERTLWQNSLDLEMPLEKILLSARAHFTVHWYTDPNGQVSSLSLGRTHYLDSQVASSNARYRISEMLIEGNLALRDSFSTLLGYQNFHNFLINSQNRGWVATSQTKLKFLEGTASIIFQRSVLSCASVPALQLTSSIIPGTASNSATFQLEIPFSQNFSSTLWASKFRTKILNSSDPCSLTDQSRLRSEILDGSFGSSISYNFPAL